MEYNIESIKYRKTPMAQIQTEYLEEVLPAARSEKAA